MTSWADHAIWWHVYPLGFAGAENAELAAAFRFPVDVTGYTAAETPDPGTRPGDPALVPAHSWVILGS